MDLDKLKRRIEERIRWTDAAIRFASPKYTDIVSALNSRNTPLFDELWHLCEGGSSSSKIPGLTTKLKQNLQGDWLITVRDIQSDELFQRLWFCISDFLENDWIKSGNPPPIWRPVLDLAEELDKLLLANLSSGILDNEPIDSILKEKISKPFQYKGKNLRVWPGKSQDSIEDLLLRYAISVPKTPSELCKIVPDLLDIQKEMRIKYVGTFEPQTLPTTSEHLANQIENRLINWLKTLNLNQVTKLL